MNGCDYRTGDVDSAIVAALLNAHTAGAHSLNQPIRPHRQPPKVARLHITDTIGEEVWNAFKQDWTMFTRANDIAVADQPIQLFSCCDSALNAKLMSSCQDVFAKPVTEIMTLLKSLAVIPVAVSVKHKELLQMHQDSGETICNFLLCVKGKAVTYQFKIKCTHLYAVPAGQAEAPPNVYVD